MLEIIKSDTHYDFMGKKKTFFAISLVMIFVSIVSLAVMGLNLGIDFRGGTKLILAYKADAVVDRGEIQKAIQEFVAKTTGATDIQVDVQDFDTGADSSDLKRFVIYTQVVSLISPEKRTANAEALKQGLGEGVRVEAVEEGEDKYFISFADRANVTDRTTKIRELFTSLGYSDVVVESEEGRRLDMEYYKTINLAEAEITTDGGPSPFDKSKEEFLAEKEAKLAQAQDKEFTATVEELKLEVEKAMSEKFGDSFLSVESSTSVSATVGEDLLNTGLIAMLYALIGILAYIALRFDFKYSPGAVLALIHDTIITIGVFSLFQVQFSQPIIAALLTVIGYSLNDTIVVYDRIRENITKFRSKSLVDVINMSVNETLSRTLLTSGTTLLVVISILLLGGGLIQDFALALFVGITVGTYSSIFVASPIIVYLDDYFKRRAAAAKEKDSAATSVAPQTTTK
ncbi:MAG: protein translocase subunit SecF [Myxococcales bacterium]|nr:protein translocase subunit SecF [Myxococcales bacterium]